MWSRKSCANSLWRNIIFDNLHFNNTLCHLSSHASRTTSKQKTNRGYLPLLTWRRLEAHRSVLIQYGHRLGKLLQWLQKSGRIQKVFCFERAERPFALVEFADGACVADAMRRVVHFPNERRVPVTSRLFFFKKNFGRDSPPDRLHAQHVFFERERTLAVNDLITAQSVSAQIRLVHTRQQLTELDTRLRFFVASCIEDSLRGLFPTSVVTPFGSSVNGFGRHGCDLDMVLDLEAMMPKSAWAPDGAMYFLTKQRMDDVRLATQSSLDAIAGVLQHIAPQCVNVRRVLHARVPIVKFIHSGADLECDLCLSNKSALLMSQLLYTYGELDARVRPFVFTVRHWARSVGITFAGPGPWISNFTLALLSIFFLQQTPGGAVLPPLTGVADMIKVDVNSELDYNFITDISTIRKSDNKQSLESLLRGFFEFYACADLSILTPSLVQVAPLARPDTTDSLYVENPFDRELNVAKNVMQSNVDAFQQGCELAMKQLDECSGRSVEQPWGLIRVLSASTEHTVEATDNLSVDVGGIFQLENEPQKGSSSN